MPWSKTSSQGLRINITPLPRLTGSSTHSGPVTPTCLLLPDYKPSSFQTQQFSHLFFWNILLNLCSFLSLLWSSPQERFDLSIKTTTAVPPVAYNAPFLCYIFIHHAYHYSHYIAYLFEHMNCISLTFAHVNSFDLNPHTHLVNQYFIEYSLANA